MNDEANKDTLNALLCDAYHGLTRGDSTAELFSLICRRLAQILDLPLVLIATRQCSGAIQVQAASRENALWSELQRIPERWDETVAGNGPAGVALRSQASAAVPVYEQGFGLWRQAAERDRIAVGAAWFLNTPMGVGVLELFSTSPGVFDMEARMKIQSSIVRRLEAFFADAKRVQEQRLLASALQSAGNAAYITDLNGDIVWSNPAFSRLSGYSADEVRGRNPRLLQSGQQGVRYYRGLWNTIRTGKVWSGETVDRNREGMTYVIRQTISPVAVNDTITHYISIHEDISRQKARQVRQDIGAHVDAVSGLLTRAAFEDKCREALTDPNLPYVPLALALVSIGDFQKTVEALGVDMEELVAASMGESIREVLRDPHAAGVIAPGEYALLLRSADPTAQLELVQGALRETFPPNHNSPRLDFRTSIARYPADGLTFEELMRCADRQLGNEPLKRARRARAGR